MTTLIDRKPDVLLSPIEQAAALDAVRPRLGIYEKEHTLWSPNLTTFASFVLPTDTNLYFLGYKAHEVPTVGAVAADGANIMSPPPQVDWQLGTDWTCLLPFTLASQTFVLTYDKATGTITAGSISSNTDSIHIIPASLNPATVAAGPIAFVLNDQSYAYLLIYAGTTLSAWQIANSESGITLTALPALTDFGEGWTNFIALPFANQPDLYFLAYNNLSGELAAGRIEIKTDTNLLQSWSVTSSAPFPRGLTFFATDHQDWIGNAQVLWLIGGKPSLSTAGSSTVMAGYVILASQEPGIAIDNDWYVDEWQLQPSCLMSFTPRTKATFLAYQAQVGMGEQDGMIHIDAGPRPGIGGDGPPDPIADQPATDKSLPR